MSRRVKASDRAGGVHEFYETPSWCVRRLLERVWFPSRGAHWLEPAAGRGAIVRAVREFYFPPPRVHVCEIDNAHFRPLSEATGPDVEIRIGYDYLSLERQKSPYEVAITNPPYSLAAEFFRAMRADAVWTALLLRMNWLSSEKRYAMFQEDPPHRVLMLPNRPSFAKKGSDSTEYAWMVWGPGCTRETKLEWLDPTPLEERKRG